VGISIKTHDKAALLSFGVLAANDGLTTTFAVVAGSLGASLTPNIVIILGLANLFADGLSMATGAYLGLKSELEFEKENVKNKPLINGFATFISFVLFGTIPLISYIFDFKNSFLIASVLVAISLLVVGVIRGIYTNKNSLKCAIENLVIGGIAAVIAYLVGFAVEKYLIL